MDVVRRTGGHLEETRAGQGLGGAPPRIPSRPNKPPPAPPMTGVRDPPRRLETPTVLWRSGQPMFRNAGWQGRLFCFGAELPLVSKEGQLGRPVRPPKG